MGFGVGVFLIAAGAVLAYAVHTTANTGGVDLHTVGVILLVVGVLATLLSAMFWSSWAGPGYFGRRRPPFDDPRL